ncbi:hypothetical protein GCM10027258_68780 [Amycolatopsis stemonae]
MPRWRHGAPAAALAVAVLAGCAGAPQPGRPDPNGGKRFGIADLPGRASPLYPGATGTRWIRLSNPEKFAIQVKTVEAKVGTPLDARGRPVTACPATSVRVDALARPVPVTGGGSADVALRTHMLPGAPPACRALTFPLSYTGTAVKP